MAFKKQIWDIEKLQCIKQKLIIEPCRGLQTVKNAGCRNDYRNTGCLPRLLASGTSAVICRISTDSLTFNLMLSDEITDYSSFDFQYSFYVLNLLHIYGTA